MIIIERTDKMNTYDEQIYDVIHNNKDLLIKKFNSDHYTYKSFTDNDFISSKVFTRFLDKTRQSLNEMIRKTVQLVVENENGTTEKRDVSGVSGDELSRFLKAVIINYEMKEYLDDVEDPEMDKSIRINDEFLYDFPVPEEHIALTYFIENIADIHRSTEEDYDEIKLRDKNAIIATLLYYTAYDYLETDMDNKQFWEKFSRINVKIECDYESLVTRCLRAYTIHYLKTMEIQYIKHFGIKLTRENFARKLMLEGFSEKINFLNGFFLNLLYATEAQVERMFSIHLYNKIVGDTQNENIREVFRKINQENCDAYESELQKKDEHIRELNEALREEKSKNYLLSQKSDNNDKISELNRELKKKTQEIDKLKDKLSEVQNGNTESILDKSLADKNNAQNDKFGVVKYLEIRDKKFVFVRGETADCFPIYRKIEQCFPNSKLINHITDSYDPKATDAVILMTRNLKHAPYWDAVATAKNANLQFIICNTSNIDMIINTIAEQYKP